MSLPYRGSNISLAKRLRKEATPQENHLWYDFLRGYPVRFQRPKSIGPYIVDLYCHEARPVIEVDGGQHYEAAALEYDRKRTEFLEKQGILVLRYSELEVNTAFQQVCEDIDRQIAGRCPDKRRDHP